MMLLLLPFTSAAFAAAGCSGISDPIQQLQCFATQQNSAAVKGQSLDQKLANKLGPERTVTCLFSTVKMIGALSKAAPGSDEDAMKRGLMAYSQVFSGMAKRYGDDRVKPYIEVKKEWVRSSSFEDVSRYYGSNCDHPEVDQLAKQGFK